jgi:hypothetical protein
VLIRRRWDALAPRRDVAAAAPWRKGCNGRVKRCRCRLGDECIACSISSSHTCNSASQKSMCLSRICTQQCRQQGNTRDNIQLWHTRYNIQPTGSPRRRLRRCVCPDRIRIRILHVLSSWATPDALWAKPFVPTVAQLALPGYPQCDRCACAGTRPCRHIRDAVILCEYSSAPSAGRVPRHFRIESA